MLPPPDRRRSRFQGWFFEGARGTSVEEAPHQSAWWKVMCLTGVDYFSTLGYQPGIAFLAAGILSPIATLVLVLLTLVGALPMYRRVAELSPHGQGSIQILEQLLPRWRGKALVLCLLGFAATGFIITITLSAADASAHIIENPMSPKSINHPVGVTLVLLTALGAVFLKGFREAVGLAVPIVGIYLVLNAIVIAYEMAVVWQQPAPLSSWFSTASASRGGTGPMLLFSLLLFPKLALGLSGFETGVAVMPLVQGNPGDTEEAPAGRIQNTKTLLTAAALIMSVLLVGSSVVTTLLVPPEAFAEGGEAYGRALAYLAHQFLGNAFGTVYDISSILILWFAGASAMAGLLNIVPRYLPGYGMAPEWSRAVRPVTLVYTGVAVLITWLFDADVDAQAGAYATGILAMMISAAFAVTVSSHRRKSRAGMIGFGVVTLIFTYAFVDNVIEKPDGIVISLAFVAGIVLISLVSRLTRATELRSDHVEFDAAALRMVDEVDVGGQLHLIANQIQAGDQAEYDDKEAEQRELNPIPADAEILFLEINVTDPSEFSKDVTVQGVEVAGHRILRADSPAVPNALAAILLRLRDDTGLRPHLYFQWSEGNPLAQLARFVLFGQGEIPPVTREVLRQAEPDVSRRPVVHVGG